MAVIKEYRCSDCKRIFDSQIPLCIHCGSQEVQRIFVTPFGFKSDKTKLSDDNLQHLTSSYKLDDFTNNQSTIHTPDRTSNWSDMKTAKDLLPAVAGGSFDVTSIRGKAAGRYEATVHSEDKRS